jgi:hypothetical protein
MEHGITGIKAYSAYLHVLLQLGTGLMNVIDAHFFWPCPDLHKRKGMKHNASPEVES